MEAQDYAITPPGKLTVLLPALIGGACLLLLVAVLAIAKAPIEQWRHAWPVLPAVLALGFVSWHMAHRSVRLGDDGLRIRRFPWPHTIPVADIELDAAEIVDLDQRTDLYPSIKAGGSSMPGYRAGRFRLRGGRWASLILTDPHHVLVLPLRKGSLVMLSVERNEVLLEALRRRAAAPTRRRG